MLQSNIPASKSNSKVSSKMSSAPCDYLDMVLWFLWQQYVSDFATGFVQNISKFSL